MEPPLPPEPVRTSGWGRSEILLVGVIALVLLGGGYYALSRNPALLGGGVASANMPPVGDMWFGSAFDATTFAMTGRTESMPVGSPIAVVAHLSSPSKAVSLNLTLSGQTVGVASGVGPEGSNVYGFVVPGVETNAFGAGSYTFTVSDVGNNTLASGNLTVTQ